MNILFDLKLIEIKHYNMILIISSCKAFEKQTKTIKDQNNFVEIGLADKF